MSYPLGPHVTRQKKAEKRFVLRPAAPTYMIQVRVSDDFLPRTIERRDGAEDSPPMSREGSRMLKRRSSASGSMSAFQLSSQGGSLAADGIVGAIPYSAIAKRAENIICDNFDTPFDAICRIQNKLSIDPELHPPEELMLVQCFADYTIDYAHRGMYGSLNAMKPVLSFPYYLSLQTIPYVTKRRQLVNEIEPNARAAILHEQRVFALMCKEYSAILLGIHNQRSFLLAREADARAMRKEQERRCYFDLAEVELFTKENDERAKLRKCQTDAWDRLEFTSRALLAHRHRMDEGLAAHIQFCLLAQAQCRASNADTERRLLLLRRLSTLFDQHEHDFEYGVAAMKALYSTCRIELETLASNAAGTRVEVVRAIRRQVNVNKETVAKVEDEMAQRAKGVPSWGPSGRPTSALRRKLQAITQEAAIMTTSHELDNTYVNVLFDSKSLSGDRLLSTAVLPSSYYER